MKAYSNCEDVREDFSALLDGELSPQEQDAVESHLSDCSLCLRELDGLKRVDTLYGELPRVDAPQGFEEDVHELLNPKRIVPWPKRARDWRILGGVLAMAAGVAVTISLVRTDESAMQSTYMAKMTTSDLNMMADSASPSAAASAPIAGGRAARERELSEEVNFEFSDVDDAPRRQLARSSDRPPGAAFPRENTFDEIVLEGKVGNSPLKSDLDAAKVSSLTDMRSPALLEQNAEMMKKEMQDPVGDKAGSERESADMFADAPEPVMTLAESEEVGALADGELDRSAGLQSFASRSESSLGFVAGNDDLRLDSRQRAAAPADVKDTLREKGKFSTFVRNFDSREGVWYERGYTDEPTIALARDSERWRNLLEKSPDLRPLVEVREQIVFQFDGLWYALKPVLAED